VSMPVEKLRSVIGHRSISWPKFASCREARPPLQLQRAHEQSDSKNLVPPFGVSKRRIEE
jgi:hypothetical protein